MTHGRTPEPNDSARAAEAAEEERAASRPFSHPYPQRHAGVRATRHISREQADADSVPGVPGGYGPTGGGRSGSRSTTVPRRNEADEEAGVTDIVGGREPRTDGEGDNT